MLLFVHEMGHVIQLRREGVKASAPMFIPFMGAVITSSSLGDSALAEARVGLAGPVLGTFGAVACLIVGEAVDSDFFRALAYIGFFLNLFNLLPVVPLDGGRAMAAMAPVDVVRSGSACSSRWSCCIPNPILLIIVFFGGYELYRRWQARKSGSLEQAAYYRVAPRHRLLVAGVYIGAGRWLLVLGMEHSHILSTPAPQLPLAAAEPRSAPRFADGALDVALGLALADRLALVVEVLASRQRDLDLRVRAREVDPRGHQREAALWPRAREAVELAPVQQQLARALGVVVLARGRP